MLLSQMRKRRRSPSRPPSSPPPSASDNSAPSPPPSATDTKRGGDIQPPLRKRRATKTLLLPISSSSSSSSSSTSETTTILPSVSLSLETKSTIPLKELEIGNNLFFVNALRKHCWEAAWVVRNFFGKTLDVWMKTCLPSIWEDGVRHSLLSGPFPLSSSLSMQSPAFLLEYPCETERQLLLSRWYEKLAARSEAINPTISHAFAASKSILTVEQFLTDTSSSGVLCLAGPPGCGKTCLVLETLKKLGMQDFEIIAPWLTDKVDQAYFEECVSRTFARQTPRVIVLENVDLWKWFSKDTQPTVFFHILDFVEKTVFSRSISSSSSSSSSSRCNFWGLQSKKTNLSNRRSFLKLVVTQRESFAHGRTLDWTSKSFVKKVLFDSSTAGGGGHGKLSLPPESVLRAISAKFSLSLENVCYWVQEREKVLLCVVQIHRHVELCTSCRQFARQLEDDFMSWTQNMVSHVQSCQCHSTDAAEKWFAGEPESGKAWKDMLLRNMVRDRKTIQGYLTARFDQGNIGALARDLLWYCIEVTVHSHKLAMWQKDSGIGNLPFGLVAAMAKKSATTTNRTDYHDPLGRNRPVGITRGYVWAREFLLVTQTLAPPQRPILVGELTTSTVENLKQEYAKVFSFLPSLKTLVGRERMTAVNLLHNSLYDLTFYIMDLFSSTKPTLMLKMLAAVASAFANMTSLVQGQTNVDMMQLENRRETMISLFDSFLRQRLGPRLAHRRLLHASRQNPQLLQSQQVSSPSQQHHCNELYLGRLQRDLSWPRQAVVSSSFGANASGSSSKRSASCSFSASSREWTETPFFTVFCRKAYHHENIRHQKALLVERALFWDCDAVAEWKKIRLFDCCRGGSAS